MWNVKIMPLITHYWKNGIDVTNIFHILSTRILNTHREIPVIKLIFTNLVLWSQSQLINKVKGRREDEPSNVKALIARYALDSYKCSDSLQNVDVWKVLHSHIELNMHHDGWRACNSSLVNTNVTGQRSGVISAETAPNGRTVARWHPPLPPRSPFLHHIISIFPL